MEHHSGPFSIPAIHHFIPEKIKPWIIIFFVLCFQLSGGIYLAAVGEMVGSLALKQQDIMMAGYASMVGMSLTFSIMFRLKFAFKPKVSLLVCAAAIIICNLISMHTSSVPVLVAACFIAGIFRMWGTFECNSTIQLWLTPKRDMSIFFCYVYLLVQGCIQLSGLTTIYTAFFSKWEYMHYAIIGLLLVMMLAVMLLYNNKRFMRKLPLYGIDWLGGLLWGVSAMSVIFLCVYGEYYDWWDSQWIVAAAVIAVVSLALNLWRASFIRHPFIELSTWRYPVVWITVLLYLVFDLLIAPSHLLEHIYMEQILGYDALNVISLNAVVLAGVIIGAVFAYRYFALRKWSYQTMTAIGFAAATLYLVFFYFTVDYNLPKEMLVIPIFLRSFGYVIVAICFITALMRVPFNCFFQTITIQGFFSAGIAGVMGTAIVEHFFKLLFAKNSMLLSAHIDNVNPATGSLGFTQLYGAIAEQSLIVTIKELYGWLALLGIVCLILFAIKKSRIHPKYVILPAFRTIRRMIGREIN